ncbi:MAG: peptidase S14 [Ruminococcaceae bacterium]|nr:peptidase S14 [Oscillospiraceae bacterium]
MIHGTKVTKEAQNDEESRQNEGQKAEERQTVPMQPLVDLGSTTLKTSRGTIHCLTIVGQIEGHMALPQDAKATKYEHVLPLLAGLEASGEIDGVLFLLNTMGGDVEAGLAIAELIAGMKKPTVSLVLGGGHSIGIPLAVAPEQTFIAPSASMTVHPIRMSGTMIAAPQTYHYFRRLQERIVRFVTSNSHISEEKFTELMMSSKDMAADVGSVIYGEEAVACGLIDRIGGLSDALTALYTRMR